MTQPGREMICDLLVRNIPRELVMSIDEALLVGAQRAYNAALGMKDGHLPSVLGQLRHFHINELFHSALANAGLTPSPLRGNQIVTALSGMITLGRFNTTHGVWNSGRRSKTRQQMCLANAVLEELVQPDMFSSNEAPSQGVAFFVACFTGSLKDRPETPMSIDIAVPDRYMQGWIFRESTQAFLKRYDRNQAVEQPDLVVPKLKKHLGKPQGKDGTES